MDHSIRAYLRRRITVELEHILTVSLDQAVPEPDADVIRMILDILRERGPDHPPQRSVV